MDVEITRKNGETFLLSDYDIIVRDFIVSSIELDPYSNFIVGGNGLIDYGADYRSREITLDYWFDARDSHDFSLIRDDLFALLNSKESFYVRELRHSGEINSFVGGKRYLVRNNTRFYIDQVYLASLGELTLETTELPFAESIGTSMDIHNDGINATSSLWGFGMGLEAVDETLLYRHTVDAGTSFKIFNPSNIKELHPFELDLKITISSVIGSERAFQVNNLTNGSRFWTNIPIRNNDIVEIDGHFVSKNKLNILRDTGRSYIWLSPGWNTFQVLPQFCDKATIEFDFPFYYL